ncbi:MAG: triose-phosphate isomerase [Bacteroidales bacterium]|nr:triose-phosphate isomerase [Bacteroidales bacterium]MCL2739202.1 triose-phosphate isomerase [Bacteroidales bacterium]
MCKKILAGNWKMNTTIEQGISLVAALIAGEKEIPAHVQVVVVPPFTHLHIVHQYLKNHGIMIGAQNCAAHAKGAYTGEVSAEMLASVSCQYVIIGHSERREYYGENAQILNQKLAQALRVGLTPIFCVGERLEEREAGSYFAVIASQLRETVAMLNPSDFSKVVIAYEPVWAIGTGKTATAEQAQEVHAFIRKTLAESFGILAAQTSILYGGSCKPSNAAELFAQNDIDGGLIGGASLSAEDFLAIARAF